MAGDATANDARHDRTLDRRDFVKLAGVAGAGLTLGPLLAACGSSSESSGSIKIGYVSPETGPLAGFGEADKFVIGALKQKFADGVDVGGDKRSIEVLVRDSQSNSNRAASVTNDLILNDNVSLVLVEGTPDNINPVGDACEANGTPCISSVAPWQSYFFGRKGTAEKPFKWTYHFFWGLEDLIAVYMSSPSPSRCGSRAGSGTGSPSASTSTSSRCAAASARYPPGRRRRRSLRAMRPSVGPGNVHPRLAGDRHLTRH